MRRIVLVLLALMAVPSATRAEPVPPERLARLARGINLSHWYAQNIRGDFRREHFDTWITRRDLDRIRGLGFTYVRLPVDPRLLQGNREPAQAGGLDAHFLALLERGIDHLLDAGLAVIVDLHPDERSHKKLVTGDAAESEKFEAFWGELAARLSRTDPERVFLEAMNEPVFNDADKWWAVQRALLTAMRRNAPRHTLVAGADMWGRIDALVRMTPYDHDRNIVYAFHCYDPFNFTHQGASWVGEPTRSLKRVPYPIALEIAEQVAPLQGDAVTAGSVWQLGHERWNYPKLKALVAPAAAWGRAHGVPVLCTEFGARRAILPEHRFNYLRDFRTACEANGVPWAVWDYAGQFGIVSGEDPAARELDEMAVDALGLTMTP